MYSPLSQDEEPLLPDTKTELSVGRTLSPNFLNRKITTIRNGWWVFFLLLVFLLVMFLDLSSRPTTSSTSSSFFSQSPKPAHWSLQGPQSPQCSAPVEKIGFMKTHKTGSSTVQNILLRWGLNAGLNFVLPPRGNHLGPPDRPYELTSAFSRSWYRNVPWAKYARNTGYNIFALHTKWSQPEVEAVLGPGAKYVTILRDPVDNFESLYNYVHFSETFHLNLEQFAHQVVAKKKPIARVNHYLGRNQQLWDLGLPASHIENQSRVKEKIAELGADFDLVMIAEQFEESLVLMGDLLCWPLANMTSLKVNARKSSAVEKLSQKARDILREWLWADQMLYDFFREEFKRKIHSYGLDRMEKDIRQLRELNAKVKSECVLEVVKNNTKKLLEDYVPWSKDVVAFKINEKDHPYCKFFGISEIHFIDHVRDTQLDRALKWENF